jgi:tRNA nucleotidyltransferase/poly(A) polymerase
MQVRPEIDTDGLRARIVGLPGFAAIRAAAAESGVRAWLVGGAVRDALLGIGRTDLDVVVDGDHLALVSALGGQARTHERVDTATGEYGDWKIDVA